jgi:hypothetical protein
MPPAALPDPVEEFLASSPSAGNRAGTLAPVSVSVGNEDHEAMPSFAIGQGLDARREILYV